MEKAGLIKHSPRHSHRLPEVKVTSAGNTHSSVVFNISQTLDSYVLRNKPRRRRSGRHSIDSVLASTRSMRLRDDTALLLSLASSSTNSLNRQSVSDNITGIMDMVSQQCSHTFRKAVRPPTPEKSAMKTNPFSSIFLLKAGRKLRAAQQLQHQQKEQVAQVKPGAQNMTTVMSAFSATKQITNDYDKKKKRLLPPISG